MPGVVTAPGEEAITKATSAISLNGTMVDTPARENAILAAQREIEAKEAQASSGGDR